MVHSGNKDDFGHTMCHVREHVPVALEAATRPERGKGASGVDTVPGTVATPALLTQTSPATIHNCRSNRRKLVRMLDLQRVRRRSEIRSHAVSQKDTNLLASWVLVRGRGGGRGRAIGPSGHASDDVAAAAHTAPPLRFTPHDAGSHIKHFHTTYL